MKCTSCGKNFKSTQMTREAYTRILLNGKTSRMGGDRTTLRECDACVRK